MKEEQPQHLENDPRASGTRPGAPTPGSLGHLLLILESPLFPQVDVWFSHHPAERQLSYILGVRELLQELWPCFLPVSTPQVVSSAVS